MKIIDFFFISPMFNFGPQGSSLKDAGTFVCTNLNLHIIMMLHKYCNISNAGTFFFKDLCNWPCEDQLYLYKSETPLPPRTSHAKFGSIWSSSYAEED
jgi:hypothetical protein